MPLRQQIRKISADLNTKELLHHLISERFPGEVVVTASLMASSVVVLKMVSDIDPATPVIFCQRPPVFPESAEYRSMIIDKLGLTNTQLNDGHETEVRPGDRDHCERMWVHYADMPGRQSCLLHINESLGPYKCWISAVYHTPPHELEHNRVDVDGKIIKVNPLVRWSQADTHQFMSENDLPYHKRAKREFSYDDKAQETIPIYNF